MATIVPEDFPFAQLANDAERDVVRALRDGLSDRWVLLPDVSLRSSRDHQLDVVLIHPDLGVLDLEVKGHRVEVTGGQWRSNGIPLAPQPFQQAKDNAYTLRDHLRTACQLPNLRVDHGVVFPNTTELVGHLPPGIERAQLLLAPELLDVEDAVERLMTARWGNQPLGQDDVEGIVAYLRPEVAFRWDPLARSEAARERLDDICEEHIRVVAGLDANRRVAVTGAAGTGKSRLAATWARRALHRGERTLLTCYNEPLAASLRTRLADDELLTIGAFLSTALRLDGMEPLTAPAGAGDEWWNVTAVGHLLRYWHQVTDRFDTIVIDEAQDFSPAWIAALETLLDPEGPRRVLLVADERQQLYERGFRVPDAIDGWVQCELVANCRNSSDIATLLRRRLDGAPAPLNRPDSTGVRWVEADSPAVAVDAVTAELQRMIRDDGRDPGSILVATTSSSIRDELRRLQHLVRWEDRDGTSVVCENVHRAKGLEADAVVLVCLDPDVDERLLYIGISRAVMELVIVGSERIVDRLGLGSAPKATDRGTP